MTESGFELACCDGFNKIKQKNTYQKVYITNIVFKRRFPFTAGSGFMVILESFFGLFFVLFSSCFLVRFWVVLGCFWGAFLEPKSDFFLSFFRSFFVLFFCSFFCRFGVLFGSVFGAKIESKSVYVIF